LIKLVCFQTRASPQISARGETPAAPSGNPAAPSGRPLKTKAINFAQEVTTATSPAEAAMLWSSHVRKNFETLTDQSKQLTALGQRVVTSAAEPLSHNFTQNL